MSDWFKYPIPFESTTTPSTTQSGSLLLNEEIPRILIVELAPGSPLLAAIKTPEVLPCNACSILVIGKSCKSLAFMLDMAPVETLFFCVP